MDCATALSVWPPCSGDLRLPHDPRQLKPPLSSPGCCGAAPRGAAGGRGESSAHSSPPVLAPDSTELLHVLSPLWLPSPHGAPRDTFPVNWSRTLVSACSWGRPTTRPSPLWRQVLTLGLSQPSAQGPQCQGPGLPGGDGHTPLPPDEAAEQGSRGGGRTGPLGTGPCTHSARTGHQPGSQTLLPESFRENRAPPQAARTPTLLQPSRSHCHGSAPRPWARARSTTGCPWKEGCV